MDVEERVALAEAADGEDLASSLEAWAGETPANQLRWHTILTSALSPDHRSTVLRAEAVSVDDLSPVDPTANDPARIPEPLLSRLSVYEIEPPDSEGSARMPSRQFSVYILASATRRLYVGVTGDLVKRIWQHKSGVIPGFTRRYGASRPRSRTSAAPPGSFTRARASRPSRSRWISSAIRSRSTAAPRRGSRGCRCG